MLNIAFADIFSFMLEFSTGHPPEFQATQALMLIAAIVLEIPIAINHIVSFVKKQSIFETTEPGMVFYREVSMIMEQLNHSINFIMYVMTCKKFRDRIVQLFRRNRVGVSADSTSVDGTKT